MNTRTLKQLQNQVSQDMIGETHPQCNKVNCPEHPETNIRLAKAIFGSASVASNTRDQSNETRKAYRRFKIGKYGLLENAIGKYIALNWKRRRLLGEVTNAQYNATRGYIILTVKHFNGEDWPIQPCVSAVHIIEDFPCQRGPDANLKQASEGKESAKLADRNP